MIETMSNTITNITQYENAFNIKSIIIHRCIYHILWKYFIYLNEKLFLIYFIFFFFVLIVQHSMKKEIRFIYKLKWMLELLVFFFFSLVLFHFVRLFFVRTLFQILKFVFKMLATRHKPKIKNICSTWFEAEKSCFLSVNKINERNLK